MYNSKVEMDIDGVVIKQDDETAGSTVMIIAGTIRTTKQSIFDDVNFGEKKAGLPKLLSGELPISSGSFALDFIRPEPIELRIGTSKGMTVKILSMKTGPLDKTGQIVIRQKIKVIKFSKEQAGDFVAMVGSLQTIQFVINQTEMNLN